MIENGLPVDGLAGVRREPGGAVPVGDVATAVSTAIGARRYTSARCAVGAIDYGDGDPAQVGGRQVGHALADLQVDPLLAWPCGEGAAVAVPQCASIRHAVRPHNA